MCANSTERLRERNVACKRLALSRAFHSRMLDPILPEYRRVVESVARRAPELPFVSTVSGTWAEAGDVTDPGYWVRELREAVRFSDGVRELAREPDRLFLEVGPGQSLLALVRGHPDVPRDQKVFASCRLPHAESPDAQVLLETLGRLWLAGAPVDWTKVHAGERRVPLPTYPFERERYWVEPLERDAAPPAEEAAAPEREAEPERAPSAAGLATPSRSLRAHPPHPGEVPASLVERAIAGVWAELLGIEGVGVHDSFFESGGNSLVATQLVSRVREVLGVDVPLAAFLKAPTIAALADTVTRAGLELLDGTEAGGLLDEIETRSGEGRHSLEPVLPQPARAMRSDPVSTNGNGTGHSLPEPTGVQFSLFFFSGDEAASGGSKYEALLECARYADRHGFAAV